MSTIKTSDFTGHPDLIKILAQADKLRKDGRYYSDVVDDEGFEYVDLVQEGGGVLGIALVGYTYVLEHIGIRFFSLAGTSAGAINTLMLASLGGYKEKKSEKILELLVTKKLFDFVDGDPSIKNLLQGFMEGKPKWWLWMKGIQNLRKILSLINNQLGINPGENFEDWVRDNMAKNEIETTHDLLEYRKRIPVLHCRDNRPADDLIAKLVMITSDVTTQTKVQFPEMACLYWKDPDKVHPSRYLRASMSIPIFFYPVVAKDIPNGTEAVKRWDDLVKYRGKIPPQVAFVDGGLLSNFPINVFHNPARVPRLPTFGVRLSSYRDDYNKSDNFFKFAGAMIGTMRQIFDLDFILKHPDYQYIICGIDADSTYNWLDFNMDDDKKIDLFLLGAKKALEFLQKFDWEGYKLIRWNLAKAANA